MSRVFALWADVQRGQEDQVERWLQGALVSPEISRGEMTANGAPRDMPGHHEPFILSAPPCGLPARRAWPSSIRFAPPRMAH